MKQDPLPQHLNAARLAFKYREAADSLGVCERTIWQLVKDDKLKACRIRGAVRISVAEIERLLAASQA